MCGRTSYSANSVAAAARGLSHEIGGKNDINSSNDVNTDTENITCNNNNNKQDDVVVEDRGNASPGQSFHIFRRSSSKNDDTKVGVELCAGIWGLLPNNGTHQTPHLLPTNSNFSVSPHYIMFNARCETLYDKPSFSGLIKNGQTCILAVSGYYEWTKSQSPSDKKKQPYFICNKNEQHPLLLAGLWTRVKTGKRIQNTTTHQMEDETIKTFTILTTDAHSDYNWLHPRQPVMLWDTTIALEWLLQPNSTTVEKLRYIPIRGNIETKLQSKWETNLSVYPVSKNVNDAKYQGGECTAEVKLEKVKSIKSFFSPSPLSGTKRAKTTTTEKKVGTTNSIAKTNDDATCTKNKDSKFSAASSGDKSWACKKCTYIHTGIQKFDFLMCEICGSPREFDDDNADTDDDGGRKRKAVN